MLINIKKLAMVMQVPYITHDFLKATYLPDSILIGSLPEPVPLSTGL